MKQRKGLNSYFSLVSDRVLGRFHGVIRVCIPDHLLSLLLFLLTRKAPPTMCNRRQFQILPLFSKLTNKDDISWESSAGRRFSWNIIPYFFRKFGKMLQNLTSAAVMIGVLRVNNVEILVLFQAFTVHLHTFLIWQKIMEWRHIKVLSYCQSLGSSTLCRVSWLAG